MYELAGPLRRLGLRRDILSNTVANELSVLIVTYPLILFTSGRELQNNGRVGARLVVKHLGQLEHPPCIHVSMDRRGRNWNRNRSVGLNSIQRVFINFKSI